MDDADGLSGTRSGIKSRFTKSLRRVARLPWRIVSSFATADRRLVSIRVHDWSIPCTDCSHNLTMRYIIQEAVLVTFVAAVSRTSAFAPVAPTIRRAPVMKAAKLPALDAEVVSDVPRKSTQPKPALVQALQDTTAFQSPTALLAGAALSLALLAAPLSANAAMSGGRMGGSYSSPRSTRIAPSRGYSSGYSRGYSSGYYSRPSVTVAPSIVTPYASPFYNPFFAPRPFFYGGGPGVVAVSRGPSLLDFLFFGGITFMIWNAITSARVMDTPWVDRLDEATVLGSGTSVAQISVALQVPDRDDPNSILSVLDRLAQTARTDSRVGIQNLTSQVALELLRRKSSFVSASTKSQHFRNREKAQREFNSQAVAERSKFEAETVSRYGGVDYSEGRRAAGSGAGDKATMAVVTLLVAVDGDSTKLPSVGSVRDVEEALRRIASDAKVDDCLQSAEILWTPEDRAETLSLKDVVADYPELRTV